MKKLLLILIFVISMVQANEIKIKGTVLINGKKATKNMKVSLNDFITTKKNSKIVFKIGKNAFAAGANTKLKFSNKHGSKSLDVLKGEVIAVFKKGTKYKINAQNLTAGIRGTGVYIKKLKDKTYFCTCYGEVKVKTKKDKKTLKATHHNPVFALNDGSLKPATMLYHSDDQLREAEAMVGRVPSFDKKH